MRIYLCFAERRFAKGHRMTQLVIAQFGASLLVRSKEIEPVIQKSY